MNNKLSGYARVFSSNGDYYIGILKDGKRHGRGKKVYANGGVKEGMFRDDEFVEKEWLNGKYVKKLEILYIF